MGAAELATALEKSKLRSLNLSYNKLECAGIQSILESLQTNTCLKVIYLYYFIIYVSHIIIF